MRSPTSSDIALYTGSMVFFNYYFFCSILVMFSCFIIVNTVFFPAHAVQLFFILGLLLITTHPGYCILLKYSSF